MLALPAVAASSELVEEQLASRGGASLEPWLAFAPYERFGPYKTAATFTPGIGTFYHPVALQRHWPLPMLPVYIFACGTWQISIEYAPTLHHLASHGILVLGVQDAKTKVMTPEVMAKVIEFVRNRAMLHSTLPLELRGRIDPTRLAVGGHSGGGPVALQAAAELVTRQPVAAGERPAVQGFVAQHAASIPEDNPKRLKANRPSEAHLQALAAEGTSMLDLCGTLDQMPYCSCDDALRDYFDRFDGPKLLVKVLGAPHMTSGAAGERSEAAYVLAYLLAVLRDDEAAASALVLGKGNDDILYSQLEPGVSPTIVTFGHEYQAVESELLWHAANHTAPPRARAAAAAQAGGGAAQMVDGAEPPPPVAAADALAFAPLADAPLLDADGLECAGGAAGGGNATAAAASGAAAAEDEEGANATAAAAAAAAAGRRRCAPRRAGALSADDEATLVTAAAALAASLNSTGGGAPPPATQQAWARHLAAVQSAAAPAHALPRAAQRAAAAAEASAATAWAAQWARHWRPAGHAGHRRWPWAVAPPLGLALPAQPPHAAHHAGAAGTPAGGASGAALMRATQHVLSHLPQIATSRSMRLPLLLPKRLAASLVAPPSRHRQAAVPPLQGWAAKHGLQRPGLLAWAAHPLLPRSQLPARGWPSLAAASGGLGATRRSFGPQKWRLGAALTPFAVREYEQLTRAAAAKAAHATAQGGEHGAAEHGAGGTHELEARRPHLEEQESAARGS